MIIDDGFDKLSVGVRSVVTIGSFDGVHSGHKVLLHSLKQMACRLGAESVVVTFDPHPRIAMGRAEGMGLLTTIEERALLLEREGIDRMVVARFDEEFRSQPYDAFVREALVARLGMVGMIVGYNHRLGRGNEGNYESLLPLASECGFELECVSQHLVDGAKISSTVVRDVMARGNMREVEHLLGQRYVVVGEAKSGIVDIADEYKLLPTSGEYNADLSYNNIRYNTQIEIIDRRVVLPEAIDGRVTIEL
ncbi:MAG: FAD synthetase family protein [Alistipes sp.]|nr:FAD synthetase family protein [Alistipes sp.]